MSKRTPEKTQQKDFKNQNSIKQSFLETVILIRPEQSQYQWITNMEWGNFVG